MSKRQTNPAVEIQNLPPLDFVLLSHLHGDHFAVPIHYNDCTVIKPRWRTSSGP